MLPHLKDVDGGLNERILHRGFIDCIVKLEFAPQPKQLGLGPLAFVSRQRDELMKIASYNLMMERATLITPSDVTKATLGPPAPPSTPNALVNCLAKMYRVLIYLFTAGCPLAVQLAAVSNALHTQEGMWETQATSAHFLKHTAPAILKAVTEETTAFFQSYATKQQLASDEYPRADLHWVVSLIRTGQSFTYPAIEDYFYSQAAREQLKPSAIPALPKPPPLPAQRTERRFNYDLDPRLKAALTQWKTQNNNGRITIGTMLLPLLGGDLETLSNQCRLAKDDCTRWALIGECSGGRNGGPCKFKHTTQIHPPQDLMTKILESIPKMRPTNKRPHSNNNQ
jgi:hypothetical protein